MNVVTNLMPSPSEQAKAAARQDRGNAQKQGSGFSDTLGSFDKKPAAPQAASGDRSANSAPASSAADAGRASAETARSSRNDAQTQGAAASDTPPAKDTAATAPAPAQSQSPKTQAAVTDATLLAGVALSASMEPLPAMPTAGQPMTGLSDAPAVDAMPALTDATADLAMLVKALTSITDAAATGEGEDAGDVDQAPSDDDATAVDAQPTAGPDLLSLLVATSAPAQPQAQQAQAPAPAPADGMLAASKGLDLSVQPADGEASTSPLVVRLAKTDVPAIDLHIDTADDGKMKVDVSVASGTSMDVVQVLDSRRYLALAPTSNATAISAAMTSDPDWSAAMSGQTTGAPLVTSTGQVVHTLKIQMNPVELGHITAAMKLVGDELSVHLTAHTLKGYAELQKDGSSILDALKSQGFSVDQVSVSLSSSAERQDSATGNRQPSDLGQQGAFQGSQRGNDERTQEQFYRQPRAGASEDAISHDNTVQPETSGRASGARPDHVYL